MPINVMVPMEEEYRSLIDNKTWKLIEKSVLLCYYIQMGFQNQAGCLGNVTKYKTRLVAKDFLQTYGVNYDETCGEKGKS